MTRSTQRRKPRIAIVVPAYNEEASLPDLCVAIGAMQRARTDWHWLTVVVDDGSTDETPRLLELLAAEHGLDIVPLPVNLGIGAAVQAGFQRAVEWGADVAVQLDGDGQHPPEAVPALVAPLLARKADVAVGSRYLPESGGAVSGWLRRVGTGLLAWLLRLVVGLRIRDVTSGFRAFNREAAKYICRYYPDDYPEVEIYVPLVRRRFRLTEVPVYMRPRQGGTSSISALGGAYYMVKVSLAVLIHLIKRIPERRPKSRDSRARRS
ncbi:MAG: glycosyltransferase family 2 protein [Deltaproteobacteria bacterium]|nr:glycosyltransferase family 2 protein [Deltaproteobacteria bacterium]